jgi:regulator of RNase E activity RraA
VNPDDLIFVDEDGVVVIPREILSAAIDKVKIMLEIEANMQRAIGRGASGRRSPRSLRERRPSKVRSRAIGPAGGLSSV